MKRFIKILSLVLTVFTMLSLAVTTASAEEKMPGMYEIYKDHTSYTMVASRKGICRYLPENSLDAIRQAEKDGADIIEIDVRATSDGVLILMDDETVTRTTYGYGENTVVAQMTYDEIKPLRLLAGQGGHGAEKTGKTIPTLESVFTDRLISASSSASAFSETDDALLMLDFDWEIRDLIVALVEEHNMQNEVIFYIDDAKPEKIQKWKSSLSFEPMIMTYFKGNVIFAATANVKKDAGYSDGIHLATKNPYGVIFGKTVQNTAYDAGIRTMAAPCIPELCGSQAQDTEEWWDYLVSAGFNVILTDNVEGLREYVDRSHNKALELEFAITECIRDWELPDFNQDKFFDHKRAYTNAAEKAESLMSRDMSRAFSDIDSSIYELRRAVNEINLNYEQFKDGTAGMTVTPVTILLAALAIAVVTVAEIYIYKKKKK